jgi:hypothetical protein
MNEALACELFDYGMTLSIWDSKDKVGIAFPDLFLQSTDVSLLTATTD